VISPTNLTKIFRPKALYQLYLLATFSSFAHAEAVDEQNPFIVNGNWLGNGSAEEVKTYPGSRNVVTNEQLHNRGALNLEDALRSTPGVHILDETGTGILPNIGVRGLNPHRSERVQLLVDGYPIAIGPYTNVGISLFPVTFNSIESIDVVRGGAAVHYGPNNVGGVINLHSRPIQKELEQTLSQKLTIAEGTGNVFSDTYYRISGHATEELALQFQANIQRGDGARDHSDTEVDNFIFGAEYQINADHQLAAQIQYYDVDAQLPGALSPEAYKQDPTQSQRQLDAYKADMLRGTLTWTYAPTDDLEFQWRNFSHDADRTFFFGQRLGTGDHWADPSLASTHLADSPRLFKVYGTEPRVSFKTGDHQITLGARYISEEVDFDVNREEFATGIYANVRDWHFETDAYALYASDTISLLNKRLEVTPGLRYEKVTTDYIDGRSSAKQRNDVEELLPGLTLGFHATNQLFLFANAQRSLVPVQTAQVTREGQVANETAWNYEIGARIQPSDTLTTNITLFQIDHEDLIQFDRPSSTYINLGETTTQGLELSADWQATPNMQLGLSYSYLDTEQKSGANQGNDLPNAPHHHISAEANYEMAQWQANLRAIHVSSSFSDAANTQTETANGSAGKLPSYTLVNARLARDFDLTTDKDLRLSMSVNNLLDEKYYFRGVDVSPVGRVPAAGRAFILEATLDF